MTVMKGLVAALVLSFAMVGCGGSGTTMDDPNAAPTKWLGTSRHLRVVGTMMGEMININLSGPTVEDTANLWCEREYQAPTSNGVTDYTQGHNSEVRIKAPVTINGEARLMDLGLKRHNWQADAAGTVVTVIPRDDANSPCTLANCTNSTMWLSWTWRNPTTNAVIYKMAAQSGTTTLGEFVGSPDQTGLEIAANTGNVGGFAMGSWSATDQLSISFDANCTNNNIDNSY
jgi:hypothetical protein